MNKKHEADPAGQGPFLEEQRDAECDDQLSRLPEKLRQRLMPFQKEGVRFALSRNGRCMIADEMGLGKTLQAIAVAYLYKEEWPLLVVVPSSLRYPWIEEMEKWIPELSPEDINLVESKSDVAGVARCKVTVLGYGLLTSDARGLLDALTCREYRVVLVDESHYLKSRNAARSKILLPLIQKARHAILLTGTPALGRPEELFMQINALYPGRFGTWSEYAKRYCNAHYRFFGNRRQWDCRGASHLDELHQRLGEVMIRRLKAQVLSQLPPKIRQRIPFDLPKDGAKEASTSFEEWERLTRTLGSGAECNQNPFAEVMGLVTRMYKQTAIAKAGAVKDYIKMMLENEKLKFLVFAHHLTMLQACTEAVIEAKTRYIRIDGSVPSSERIQLVHQFQNDPETRVAILSIQAAGQGLTFTAATHVVFAELYWNPGHVKQAEDRAHRIGQSCSVHVHYLIARGTFDTVMWAMLNRKETVTGSTLNGKKEYLKAEVGDKEKWDFLNFASVWTPSEAVDGGLEDDGDGIFFSHFEKDKQRDIRSFFSPSTCEEKKRKWLPEVQQGEGEAEGEQRAPERRADQTGDLTPRVKRLRPVTPRRVAERRRLSSSGKGGSPNPFVTPIRVPGSGRQGQEWSCDTCTYANSGLLPYCEMCESPRSSQSSTPGQESGTQPPSPESSPPTTPPNPSPQTPSPVVEDMGYQSEPSCTLSCGDEQPRGPTAHTDAANTVHLYEGLKFRASRNTDRIYLYTKDGTLLNCNFIPMDIKLDNWEDLPEEFNHRENRRHVLRFVREWSSLTTMKQRVIRRSGSLFYSPVLALEELSNSQRRQSVTKRYLTKEDVAQVSLSKAQSERGTVRIVTKETFFAKRTFQPATAAAPDKGAGCSASPHPGDPANLQEDTGYLQAVDSTGTPLCMSCQLPCNAGGSGGAWDARFCQQSCQEEFQVRSSQAYMRARVLEVEQGVCQHCGLQAHQLFQRIRDAPPACRKEMLEGTWLAQLPLKQLNEMIRSPSEGQFWQVDHIRPVYRGGGQCSLDNLQTLCTVCHRERTAQQAKDRSQMKKETMASKVASDITRFFIRK